MSKRLKSIVADSSSLMASSLQQQFEPISEGSAVIDLPKGVVFYNPVQQFNRDLSIAVINTFQKVYSEEKRNGKQNFQDEDAKISILEALSASGLRSIRYAKEIGKVSKIVANDIDPNAVKLIEHNVEKNTSLPQHPLTDIIEAVQGDANFTMMKYQAESAPFHVIDLDPYGSAAPFIDTAVRTVADGGLICVTCTDLAVLCASYPESCYAKYSSVPLKGEICHEMALRIVLSTIEASATRYKRHIVPLISCNIDFYLRIFLRVYDSPIKTKHAVLKKSLVIRCVQCKSAICQPLMSLTKKGASEKFHIARLESSNKCNICGGNCEIAGPVYSAAMHDRDFVKSVLQHIAESPETAYATRKRMEGMLTVISEELPVPFYYSLTEVSSILKASVPPLLQIRSAFLNLGYSVSNTHCTPQGLKTDAPLETAWNIFSHWVRTFESDRKNLDSHPILSKGSLTTENVDFTLHKDANPESRKLGLSRYPENPTKNWGPLARAKAPKSL